MSLAGDGRSADDRAADRGPAVSDGGPPHVTSSAGRAVLRVLGGRPDETILKWLFRGLLVATAIILGVDLAQMRTADQRAAPLPGAAPAVEPYLPSPRDNVPPHPVLASPEALSAPARFELVSGGRLVLEGAIDAGAAERFAAEIDKRGDYVNTVVLNSPGGSVGDALAISGMIRDHGFSTFVESGGYCASSCPLILAGGIDRTVATDASVGVHRVSAASSRAMSAQDGMDNAQRVSAEIQRTLVEMGVDPHVWMHAMETPKEELFYFSPEQLMTLQLATRLIASNRQ